MIISQTPLRVSFAGGGTDFPVYYRAHEGVVVSTAIDKFVYVIVSRRFDRLVYVNYTKKEIVERVEDIQHELVREAMLRAGVRDGIEITMLADVPAEGSGLGSSSSLTVGLLHALRAYQGELVSAEQLAQEACQIEIETCGKPIGKQDQYIAAYGGICEFRFRQDDRVEVRRAPKCPRLFHSLSSSLMLFYTGRTRQASVILQQQNGRTTENLDALHRLKALAARAWMVVQGEHYAELAELLDQGWRIKRGLADGISDPAVEEMYQRALDAGAGGGKLVGAGGGGFLLLHCDPRYQRAVRNALRDYRELPVALEPDGSKIIFQQRRNGYEL
jgi:D-glycero-alpha-D-manno-heptose-7-phosphate kinase